MAKKNSAAPAAAAPAPAAEEVKDERTLEEKVAYLLQAVEQLKNGKTSF